MPIIEDSAPLIYPLTDYSIVKYMDLTKFLSLIQRRAMFFCRQDKLEDDFEGQTAKRNYDWRIESLRQWNNSRSLNERMNDEDMLNHISERYGLEKKLKSLRLINCWNKGSKESAALWKIYSDFGKGIMIRSSVSRIGKAFRSNTEMIRMSEVKYINFENDLMQDGNDFYLVTHKQEAYSYEDEVRLIHEIIQGVSDWKYDWENEENINGKYFELVLDDLIDDILVGPYCPKWQFDLIKDILLKYKVNKELKRSELTVSN